MPFGLMFALSLSKGLVLETPYLLSQPGNLAGISAEGTPPPNLVSLKSIACVILYSKWELQTPSTTCFKHLEIDTIVFWSWWRLLRYTLHGTLIYLKDCLVQARDRIQAKTLLHCYTDITLAELLVMMKMKHLQIRNNCRHYLLHAELQNLAEKK